MHQQIIWVKSRPVLTDSIYMWANEPCIFGWIKGQEHRGRTQARGRVSVHGLGSPSAEIETNEHPTSKPNRLFAIPMQLDTSPNDLCYEPFSGSGSRLVAAEQLGHRCYAIELEPRFVDGAILLWEKLTGQKAEVIAEERGADGLAPSLDTAEPNPSVYRYIRMLFARIGRKPPLSTRTAKNRCVRFRADRDSAIFALRN